MRVNFFDDPPPDQKKVVKLSERKPKPVDGPPWHDLLQRNDKGAVLPSVANAMVIFTHDAALSGMLAFNEFSSRAVIMRAPPETEGTTTPGPFPRAWEDADRTYCLAYVQRAYSSRFGPEAIGSVMQAAAMMRRFHPVREYLESLQWDGIPRLGVWLSEAFGAPIDPYHHAVASKFLRAAVRRVKQAGCKFDSMLVLEGDQDIGKSRACRALFGDDWFTDSLPDMTGRDASAALEGVWGIELAEIEALIRSEPETVKAFLSRQVERYRPSYGRTVIERPRQCVLIGTTNSDDYARDATGNRRLWPVQCEFANVEWLLENRDQLWAEAAATEQDAPLWLEDEVVRVEAKEQQAKRHDDDPWEEHISSYASGRTIITVPELLKECIGMPIERQNKGAQMRVAKVLKRQGWQRNSGGPEGRKWLRSV